MINSSISLFVHLPHILHNTSSASFVVVFVRFTRFATSLNSELPASPTSSNRILSLVVTTAPAVCSRRNATPRSSALQLLCGESRRQNGGTRPMLMRTEERFMAYKQGVLGDYIPRRQPVHTPYGPSPGGRARSGSRRCVFLCPQL